MRKLLLLALLIGCFVKTDQAAEIVAGQTEVSIYSAYVWRGQVLYDTPVWQPAQNLYLHLGEDGEYGTLKARVWASFAIAPNKAPYKFASMSIIDETVSYTKTFFDCLDTEFGHIGYQFPTRRYATIRDTDELLAGVRWRNPYLTPSVYVYWDYGPNGAPDNDSLYFDFAFTHPFQLSEDFTFVSGAGFGFGNEAYNRSYSGDTLKHATFNNFHLDFGLWYKITSFLKAGLNCSYFFNLDHEVRESNYCVEDEYKSGGILRGGFQIIATY